MKRLGCDIEYANSKKRCRYMTDKYMFPYMRVGKLCEGSANPYGTRACVPVNTLEKQLDSISLVIPCLTEYSHIPSSKTSQLREEYSVLRRMKHVRYFGVFDIDAEFKNIFAGSETNNSSRLFVDDERSNTFKTADDVVKAFTQRLASDKTLNMDRITEICPSFGRAYSAASTLAHIFKRCGKPALCFFSGGKGFRVLVRDERLFFIVHWFGLYAETFATHILPTFLREELRATDDELCLVMQYIDACVFDREKGVKPDYALAHPTTQMYPCFVRQNVPLARSQTVDHELQAHISDFWNWVVATGGRAAFAQTIQADFDLHPKKRPKDVRVIPFVLDENTGHPALRQCIGADDEPGFTHAVIKGADCVAMLLKPNGAKINTLPMLLYCDDRPHFLHETFPVGENTILAGEFHAAFFGQTRKKKTMSLRYIQHNFIAKLFPHVEQDRRTCIAVRSSKNSHHATLYWPGIGMNGGDQVNRYITHMGGTLLKVRDKYAVRMYGSRDISMSRYVCVPSKNMHADKYKFNTVSVSERTDIVQVYNADGNLLETYDDKNDAHGPSILCMISLRPGQYDPETIGFLAAREYIPEQCGYVAEAGKTELTSMLEWKYARPVKLDSKDSDAARADTQDQAGVQTQGAEDGSLKDVVLLGKRIKCTRTSESAPIAVPMQALSKVFCI